jgi:hypothetical protein
MTGLSAEAAAQLEAAIVRRDFEITVEREARRRVETREQADRSQQIRIIPAAEIRKRPKPEFLIEGMMPATGTGVLVGQSGTFKSFLVLSLMLCIGNQVPFPGNQVPFLGRQVLQPAGRCVYVMGEGQFDAGLRLDSATAGGLSDALLSYIEQPFPLSDSAAVDEVIQRCRELASGCAEGHQHGEHCRQVAPVRLVVFDSFADFFGAADNESSATDMQRLIGQMKRLSAGLGCVVMANAHSGHGGTDEEGKTPCPRRAASGGPPGSARRGTSSGWPPAAHCSAARTGTAPSSTRSATRWCQPVTRSRCA